MSAPARALVSLHDVTPAHGDRVFAAIDHLRGLGVTALNLLVVPDFHHRAHLAAAPEFCARLLATLRPDDEIQLHGFFHLADVAPASPRQRLTAAVMTAGEGEFQALDLATATQRIRDGLDVLRQTLDVRPEGFVAPAWLQNTQVRQAVRDCGLAWCEDQLRIHDLVRGRTLLAPALSWASRSWSRRIGSRLQARIAERVLPLQPLVRLAVHPNDYHHRELVDSIGRVTRRWLTTHRSVAYREVLA